MVRPSRALAVLTVIAAGGACREAPPPPGAPPVRPAAVGPAWLDDVAAKCARVASCTHAHDAPRLRDPGACVDWWLARRSGEAEPARACLDGARTCGDVGACLREPASSRAAAWCAAHPGVMSACDGVALVSCADDDAAESSLVDCAALAGACEERRAHGMVIRGCASRAMCPPGVPEERCEGTDAVIECRDGMVQRAACPRGTRCAEHTEPSGEPGAMCEPVAPHPHCAQLGARSCQDGELVECVVHGHFGDVRVSDCDAMGLRCVGAGARARCVVPAGEPCEPGPARCDGDDGLAFCAAGRMVRVSCASLGLGRCDPDAQGPAAACGAPLRAGK